MYFFVSGKNLEMRGRYNKHALIAGGAVALCGGTVMVGWLTRTDILLSLIPNLETMKWNTAVGFVLAGIILCLQSFSFSKRSVVIKSLSILLVLFGALHIYQGLYETNLGIDELFVEDYIARSKGGIYPGRMSNSTAFCFFLLGLAQLCVFYKNKLCPFISSFFNHVVVFVALVSIVGYMYEIPTFHKLTFLVSMALHTSIGFLVLGFFFQMNTPQWGLTALFFGDKVGQIMARSLFPLLTTLVLLLGVAWVNAHRLGVISMEFGISLFVLLFLVVGLLMIWFTATSLNKIDRGRRKAEAALKEANAKLELKVIQRTAALSDINTELQKSNERNKIFVSQAPNAIAMFDTEMKYIAASEKWYEDYDLFGKDIIGKSHYSVFPEIEDKWKEIHEKCLKGDVNKCDEAGFEREDGSMQWIKWEVRPWYSSPDEIGGILMYTEDISTQKIREQEKRRIEEIWSKTSDIARIGVWDLDLADKKVNWDKVTKEIHEVGEDYVPEFKTAIDFYKEGKSREAIQSMVDHTAETGEPFDAELEITTASGRSKWIRTIGQAEYDKGECIRLYGLFQDIDQIKNAQYALDKVNQELTAILDSGTNVSIISTDLDGVITHFSKGAEALLGYSMEEMVGITTPNVLHCEEEVRERGIELSTEYGRNIHGFDVFTEAVKRGGYENREWTYISKDERRFPVQLAVTGIRDSDGNLKGYLGVATDISEIKQKEERLKEVNENLEALAARLTNQNRQLANFAQITSHNLRAPVSNLLALLNLYNDSTDQADRDMLIEKFGTVITHLFETLNDLMEALKIQEQTPQQTEQVSFQKVFDKTLELLSGQILEHQIQVDFEFDEASEIRYNSDYMDSIFLNLMSNAIKYRSTNRQAWMSVKTLRDEEGNIELHVEDNGLGINMKRHAEKLFGLHKTFHRNPDAKGVGLYLTKTQIVAMGGNIKAYSEIDKGTKFVIKFNKSK